MPAANQPLVYVSYAWRSRSPDGQAAQLSPSDDREAIVDELCRVLDEEDQIVVGRDKKLVKIGDSIVDFACEIASGCLILAVISHKSLRSDWCMVHELLQAFRRRNFDLEEFGTDVLALVLEDALDDLRDPRELVKHWSARLEQEQELMQLADPDKKESPESWKVVNQMVELRGKLPDLIRALSNRAMLRGAEAIREKGFHAIRKLVRQRLEDKKGLADQIRPSDIPPPDVDPAIQEANPDQGFHFLALTLQRAQAASGESGEFLYSWRIALKEPANSYYEPCSITPSTGPLVRRSSEPTLPSSAAAGHSHSSVVDLLQEIADWLQQQAFGTNCILELFVPVEWLDFCWSSLQLRDSRRSTSSVVPLHGLVPYVLRSWERLEHPQYRSVRAQLEAKYRCLSRGEGSWLAGPEACQTAQLSAAENDASRVGIKRFRPLENDLDQRLAWLESMLLTMAPVALWPLPDRPRRTQSKLLGYLNRYGDPLAGHNTGDPVAGDCRRLEALPLHRKAIADDPLVHDIALLFDHPERAPAAAVDQAPILSF
jgi:hypothetical protein